MTRLSERRVFAGLLALAVLAWVVIPTYPNYDSYTHLNWGNEILHGHSPSFESYAAPTEHPLFIALCALLDVAFGEHADRWLILACVLAFVSLIWAVFRLGRACFGHWPGVLGAVFCASSFALLLLAARGYVDVLFLAVVFWAAVIEAESPGARTRTVAAMLVIAGLLRPEAWVLAGLYWLWAGRRRWDLLVLAAVAPVVWAAVDLAVTGDPLFSLHSTSSLAADLNRVRGVQHVPKSFVTFLADTARPPVFLAGLGGLWLLLRDRGRARHVPLALLGAGTLTFIGTGVAGLAILPRYLTVPAVALCPLAGYAVAGFADLPPGRLRTLWRRAAYAAAVVGVAFLAVKASSFTKLARELRFIHHTHAVVVAAADLPAVRQCAPVSLPTYRLVPDLRFALGDETGAYARSDPRGPQMELGLYVVGEEKAVKRFGQADGVPRSTNDPPARGELDGFRRGFLTAYSTC